MYRIEDRTAYIRLIQKFLGIKENGIFDKKTKEAVKDAQRYGGLIGSGVVDRQTFELLLAKYKDRRIEEADYPLYSFPYKNGDRGEDITVLNNLLRKVLRSYTRDHVLPKGDYYNVYTDMAVDFLQRTFGMERRSYVDKKLFARILDELRAIELEKQNFE